MPDISLADAEKVFDSKMLWGLYKIGNRHVFMVSDGVPRRVIRIAVFNEDFRHGDVFSLLDGCDLQRKDLPNPLEFPLSEVLMVCLLAKGRGLMVHACGICDNGRGYLFAGNSAHGKSTLANLWKEEAMVLNDDRIILRLRKGRFWMYGTPWHGDYNGVSPQGVPLDKIFFLRHAENNSADPKKGVSASAMILARCFPPLWDPEGMRYTLDFCSQLAEEVPCYELGVVPDRHILDFVRCMEA